jgi:ethanolamine utilization protein EutN
MHLGRVIGRVVCTQRLPGLLGEKFLLVRPLDEKGEPAGETLVACDAVGSGLGDIVHVCDGRESTLALHDPFVPIDATIVGHVEEFEHDGPGPKISGGASAGHGS